MIILMGTKGKLLSQCTKRISLPLLKDSIMKAHSRLFIKYRKS